jgi:hypothetical protein
MPLATPAARGYRRACQHPSGVQTGGTTLEFPAANLAALPTLRVNEHGLSSVSEETAVPRPRSSKTDPPISLPPPRLRMETSFRTGKTVTFTP